MSGDRVRPLPFGIVPRGAVEQLGHGIGLSVYVALASYANPDGECRPMQARLAEMLHVSDRQVDRGIAELKRAGLLVVKPRLNKGRKTGNEYILGSATGDASVEPTEAPRAALPQSATGGASISTIEQTIEQTNVRASCDDLHVALFDAFWAVYPRKTAKRTARRAWDARMREGVEPQLLVDSARAYAAGLNGTDQRYIKHAATFLGPDRHWLDVTPAPPEKVFQPGFVDL